MTTQDESVDLGKYIGIFLNRWWLLVLLPTLGGLGALFYSNNQDPVYEAKVTILVQYRGSAFALGTSDFSQSNQLATTYQRQVTAKPFLEWSTQQGELPFTVDALRDMVSASVASHPPAVEVKIRQANAEVAAAVAELVAEGFIDYAVELRLAEIARIQTAAAAQGIVNAETLMAAQLSAVDSLSILDEVAVPDSPVVPRTRQNVLSGVMLGILLAAGGALLLETLGSAIKTSEEFTSRFGVMALGAIFKWDPRDTFDGEPILVANAKSSYSEAFRQIRANIEFATANRPGNAYVIVSAGPQEGKSTVVSNLAIAFAQSGKRVVLLDCDMRRPSLHKAFWDHPREPGLSNYLGGKVVASNDVKHATKAAGVYLVPAGPTPPNPAELLGSQKMSELLTELKDEYDIVFVDSPPVLLVADASVLASMVDGVIIVADASAIRASSTRATLKAISVTQTDIVGAVVNKLRLPRFVGSAAYPYYYHYSSQDRYYYGGDENSTNGTGTFYQRAAGRAKSVFSRIRGRGK